MKRLHILTLWTLLICAFQVTGQDFPSGPPETQVQVTQLAPLAISQASNGINRASTNCGADTVRYVRDGKATGFLGVTMNVPSEFAGYSQYYDAPQEVTVSGMVFYAGVNSPTPTDTAVVKCRVYLANPDSTMGVLLTEKDITVYQNYNPADIDGMKYVVNFDSVAVCNQPYFVSIWTETTQPLGVISDDYNAGDGQNEDLGYWYWTGDSTWYPSGEFFVWDVDWLIEPVVEYVLTDSLTLSTNSICVPDSLCALHSRSPIFDNRMYNQNALAGTPELGDSYDWGDGTVTTAFDSCHTYTSIGQYVVDYSATILGWTSTCSVSSIDTLNAGTVPTASFTNTSTLLSADFTDASTGPTISSWDWDFGDGNTSTQQSPSHTYTVAGTYTVCLIVNNSCGADTICNTVVVTCPVPVSSFTSSISALTADFSDASTGNNITGWVWDFGDGNASTGQNPSHTYAADGTYFVCLYITDDCGTHTSCDSVTITTLGLNQLVLNDDQINVSPNPSNGSITLSFDLKQTKDIELIITDASGRTVYENVLKKISKSQQSLNLDKLADGMYYLNFSSDQARVIKPIVVSSVK